MTANLRALAEWVVRRPRKRVVPFAFLLTLHDATARSDMGLCVPLVAKRFEQRLAQIPANDRTEARMSAIFQEVVDRLVDESNARQ